MRKTVRKGDLIFWWCPGCKRDHAVNIVDDVKPVWSWNGDIEKPTFIPSVLRTGEIRCHCFVRDGRIQFLNDCAHNLKGQIVGIPDWPFEEENQNENRDDQISN